LDDDDDDDDTYRWQDSQMNQLFYTLTAAERNYFKGRECKKNLRKYV
jgi:hypothetical protein